MMIALFCMIPGLLLGILIRMKTTVSKPPGFLVTIYAMLAFVMSIMWIQYTSNVIMDLLQLFGFITRLPQPLLALTIIAWGNCLGDMTADVAMTKRGFGEMAITGCIAGPIFNVLMGLGLSTTLTIIKSDKGVFAEDNYVIFSLYKEGKLNKEAVLPLTLLIA